MGSNKQLKDGKTMEYIVFLVVNDHYYLPLNEKSSRGKVNSQQKLVSREQLSKLEDGQVISCKAAAEFIENSLPLRHKRYIVVRRKNHLLFIPCDNLWSRVTGFFRRKIDFEFLYNTAINAAKIFRLENDECLLKTLLGENPSLGECLWAFCEYIFCDNYQLWLYNENTNVFSRTSSSVESGRDFVKRDGHEQLHEFMDSNDDYRLVGLGAYASNTDQLKNTKTIVQVRLELGEYNLGIVNFYCKYPDCGLNKQTQQYIKSFLEFKFLEQLERAEFKLFQIEQHFITDYSAGKIKDFLYELTERICSELCFENCAIYLKDADANRLVAKSMYGGEHYGKPEREIVFDLDKPDSLTAWVYNNREMAFSYNLADDIADQKRDIKMLSNITEHELQNWIGLPLVFAEKPIGVLNICNKYKVNEKNEKQIISFLPMDLVILKAVCTSLSNILHIEEQFEKTIADRIKTAKMYVNQRDFNKVFLHEIRTPISMFSTSTRRIKRMLDRTSLSAAKLIPITNKLNDIKLMGERLAFITRTYNVNELIENQHPRQCSVLADIILPVLNITKEYLEYQYGVSINFLKEDLEHQWVYCDKILLNLVLNTLISNAGKYSRSRKSSIFITGMQSTSGKYFNISVESNSIEIHEDETESIFQNGCRGKKAISEKVIGTGIGLYLGRRIMQKQGGDLLLISRYNPVVFQINIPKR